MRHLLFLFLITGALFAITESLERPTAEAARPTNISFSQTCAGDKVNVSIFWSGDPAAREIWVDVNKTDDGFSSAVQSAGPLPGRTANYQWRGLDQHTVYYWRVNQLMPSGSWEASVTFRHATACGNVAAPADAKIEVIGFTDKQGAAESSLSAPRNGRVRSCNPERLYAHVRIGRTAGNRGDSEIVDATVLWYQGQTVISRVVVAVDVDAASYVNTYSYGKSGGHAEGAYSFQLWTGGDGTWKQSASGNFTLDC